MKLTFTLSLVLIAVLTSCESPDRERQKSLNDISDKYVELALEIGKYNADFIDSYYGNNDWSGNSLAEEDLPYEELKWKCTKLLNELKSIDGLRYSKLELLRYHFLTKQVESVRTKLDIMSGKNLPFDVESLRLYDAVAPHIDLEDYDRLLDKLDALVPGEGNLADRYEIYAKDFIIPADKVDQVFRTAIAEAKRRISDEIDLPENESFDLEYVTDQPWPGYNWYKGNAHSVIQINTDFPIFIERAIDLACHEGYPGHHVYNIMLEKSMVIDKEWTEFQVYPLFSPQSFIAEGTANYGTSMAFSSEERLSYEMEVLFPMAGIDPSLARDYYKIQDIRSELVGAQIQIARAYLNREIDANEAAISLQKYLQYEESRAKQRVKLYDRYGSYVVNYSLGRDLVEQHVNAGIENDNRTKWELYLELLTTPRTASILQTN